MATGYCVKRGFDARDHGMASAINLGVALAVLDWDPMADELGRSACRSALHCCWAELRHERRWWVRLALPLCDNRDAEDRRRSLGVAYVVDEHGWMATVPYSIDNLHAMADDLRIGRRWFAGDHYDRPKSQADRLYRTRALVPVSSVLMHDILAGDLG